MFLTGKARWHEQYHWAIVSTRAKVETHMSTDLRVAGGSVCVSSRRGLPGIARAHVGRPRPDRRVRRGEDDLLVGAEAINPDPHDLADQVGWHGVLAAIEGHYWVLEATVRVTPIATV